MTLNPANPLCISSLLVIANLASMAAVFVYSACVLSVRQWTWRQPELWIHSFLIGGVVAVAGSAANEWQPHHWTEILFNVAVAGYFVMRSRRIHLLDNMFFKKKRRRRLGTAPPE